MRDLVIKRLNEIKENEGNFSPLSVKWGNVFVEVGNTTVHISKVDWDDFDDERLLMIFEKIIRKLSREK